MTAGTVLLPGVDGTDDALVEHLAYRARPTDLHVYLGTHEISWLRRLREVPLFIAHQRLARQKTWPRARTPWALDSGGFNRVTQHGGWDSLPPGEYVAAVHRYDTEIGSLEWAAPQDWMCEDIALRSTGKTVAEHQRLTTDNWLDLTARWHAISGDSSPFMPVLQGATPDDYLRHADQYEAAGVALAEQPLVGLGSVCRRQATKPVLGLVRQLADRGYRLHGYGVKAAGLAGPTGTPGLAPHLTSCDSLAWSQNAFRNAPAGVRALDGCTHKTCSNCLGWALAWRDRLITRVRRIRDDAEQLELGAAG